MDNRVFYLVIIVRQNKRITKWLLTLLPITATLYAVCSLTIPQTPKKDCLGVTIDTPKHILQTLQTSIVTTNVFGAEDSVINQMTMDATCLGVYFDDCYAFAVTKETARQLLQYLDATGEKVVQQHENAVGVCYSKNITFAPITDIANKYVMAYEDVIKYLMRDDTKYKTLTVTPNDTVETIAKQLQVSTDILGTYSATINDVVFADDWSEHTLIPGTKIRYPVAEPYLSAYYVTEGEEIESEELEPELIYDDTMYEDELVTEDKGEPTLRKVTYQYIYDTSEQLVRKEYVTETIQAAGRKGKVRIGTKPTRIMADTSNVNGSTYFTPIIDETAYISAYLGDNRGHKGIDIAAPYATPIYAAAAGTVTDAAGGWNGGYGNAVVIDNDDGNVCRYAHMSWYVVSTGEQVEKGQLIGYVGNTGASEGNHLHFEVICNNVHRNPLNYINFPIT